MCNATVLYASGLEKIIVSSQRWDFRHACKVIKELEKETDKQKMSEKITCQREREREQNRE